MYHTVWYSQMNLLKLQLVDAENMFKGHNDEQRLTNIFSSFFGSVVYYTYYSYPFMTLFQSLILNEQNLKHFPDSEISLLNIQMICNIIYKNTLCTPYPWTVKEIMSAGITCLNLWKIKPFYNIILA